MASASRVTATGGLPEPIASGAMPRERGSAAAFFLRRGFASLFPAADLAVLGSANDHLVRTAFPRIDTSRLALSRRRALTSNLLQPGPRLFHPPLQLGIGLVPQPQESAVRHNRRVALACGLVGPRQRQLGERLI